MEILMNNSQIQQFISSLSQEQKTTLLSILKQKKNSEIDEQQTLLADIFTNNTFVTDIKEERFSNGLFCPKCGCTENIVKAGKGVNNKQRYLCKNCSKIFTSTTDTFLHSTKKDIEIWKRYIQCMIRKLSIRKSAVECGISIRTSFMWRHKILDSLRLSDKTELKGIVEADEAYFRVSYKGSKPVERDSRKRGGETHKRGLSKEQVCVVCGIERDSRKSVAKIGGLGKTSIKTIDNSLGKIVKEKSILCTDKEKSYIKFAKSNNLEHIRLDSFKSKRGIYHINHINSYHKRHKNIGYFK